MCRSCPRARVSVRSVAAGGSYTNHGRSVAAHPLFCNEDAALTKDAAHEARPRVYGKDGEINWDSVSTGWNTGCGAMPGNWSATEKIYARDSGDLATALLVVW